MAVPNTFATATSAIPLANLDSNFAYYDAGFSLSGSAVTFAGSITLTTGTANGVPYLHGSKVLTSGGVLTFNGTILSSTGFAGALNGTVGATTASTGAFTTLSASSTVSGAGFSTYLASPPAIGGTAAAAGTFTALTGTSITNSGLTATRVVYSGTAGLETDSANLTFNGTILTSTGFAGPLNGTVGATTANTGAFTTLSTTGAVTITGGTANGVAYLNGSKVLTTGSALVFDGTNLGIGTTTTTNKLNIQGNTSVSDGSWFGFGDAEERIRGDNAGIMQFFTGGTERIRIDASGRLLVGKTSGISTVDVVDTGNGGVRVTSGTTDLRLLCGASAAYLYNASAVPTIFTVNASEAMRLDASGNLLVGTTSTSVTNGGMFIQPGAGGETYYAMGHKTGTASGSIYAGFYYAGTSIGSISQSGTAAVLYNVTSDERLKENIQDAAPASALIDNLQVRQYNWKSNGSHQRYGFVAQELVTVAPEAVHQPADPEEMMAVDYSKLVPMLVKEIQDLRKRLAALEAA